MAGMLIENGLANSVTDASPRVNRTRIARRVGSASAANVLLRWSDTHIASPKFAASWHLRDLRQFLRQFDH
jgi:hypothetical protein